MADLIYIHNALKEPLSRIVFTRAYPTCHDVNILTRSAEHLDVIIGFSSGDLMWYDPISQKYVRLNKDVSPVCVCEVKAGLTCFIFHVVSRVPSTIRRRPSSDGCRALRIYSWSHSVTASFSSWTKTVMTSPSSFLPPRPGLTNSKPYIQLVCKVSHMLCLGSKHPNQTRAQSTTLSPTGA